LIHLIIINELEGQTDDPLLLVQKPLDIADKNWSFKDS